MSGQINEWLFNNLVGISPAEDGPGFRKFLIKPDFLSDLAWVKGSFASISGDINIAWRRIAGHLELDVVVPENTHALLYLPASNPKQIFEHNRSVSKSVGVQFSRSENRQLVYALSSGKYHFRVKTPN
jgi:alpha-L-rhamnosidase